MRKGAMALRRVSFPFENHPDFQRPYAWDMQLRAFVLIEKSPCLADVQDSTNCPFSIQSSRLISTTAGSA